MGKRYRLGSTKKKNSPRPSLPMLGHSRRQTCGIICICLLINVILYVIYANYAVTSPVVPPRARPYTYSADRVAIHERMIQFWNATGEQDPSAVDKKPSDDASNLSLLDPHVYPYMINEPDFCTKEGGYVRLIVVVPSGVGDFDQRKAIRETWGSYGRQKDLGVRVVFLVGSIQNQQFQKQLQSESVQHHDIVQVDFHDSYRNLTIKSVAMLKWVSLFCQNARYVLKSDDDMYVNIPKLLQALDHVKESRFFLCSMQYGARPIRNLKSKWYVLKNEYSEKVYPNYCSGTAYAYSVSVSADLFHIATRINIFWLEDVFISGILPKHVQLKQLHNPAFEYWKNSLGKPCHFKRLITSHQLSPRDLRRIWRMLKRPLRC